MSGVVDLRNAIFESKVHSYQTAPGARGMYGYDPHAEGNGILVPESIRQRLWTEANAEAIPTLKATWASIQSDGKTSGLTFTHNYLLTISNREEGWQAIKSASIQVGVAWASHLIGGGFSNLRFTAANVSRELTKMYKFAGHTFDLTKAPIEIPRNPQITEVAKQGYDQVKFSWSSNGYKFEARWHTPTPGAPSGSGNTWVVTRTTPGTATGQMKAQHILIGENKWLPMKTWQDAVKAYQTNTTTTFQNLLLKWGHHPG